MKKKTLIYSEFQKKNQKILKKSIKYTVQKKYIHIYLAIIKNNYSYWKNNVNNLEIQSKTIFKTEK